MKVEIPCPFCNGTGTTNNSATFYNAGETPEDSENCKVCEGKGYIEEENPEGVRVAMLVAKKIIAQFPIYKKWETVYIEIVANITNAVNFSLSKHKIQPLITEGDDVFSDDELPIDKVFESWIDKGNYVEEAKNILGIRK